MFRNWIAIAKLEDGDLIYLAARTKNKQTLDGLERGFPELFSAEPIVYDGVWPRSAIQARMAAWQPGGRKGEDEHLRDELGLPVIGLVSPHAGRPQPSIEITQDEFNELVDKLAREVGGGERGWWVFDLKSTPPLIELRDGRRFYGLQDFEGDELTVVPVECIDLNA